MIIQLDTLAVLEDFGNKIYIELMINVKIENCIETLRYWLGLR